MVINVDIHIYITSTRQPCIIVLYIFVNIIMWLKSVYILGILQKLLFC